MRAYLVLFCILLLVGSPAPGQGERIGVSLPLSGAAATYGVDIRNILLFLNKRRDFAGHHLIFEDDRCDAKEAVTIAQRFVNVERVRFVIGYPCSSTILSSAPFYEKHKVVMISAAAAAPSVSQAGDFVFRTRPSEAGAAALLAADIGQRFERIALINEETEYAQSISDAFLKELPESLKVDREIFLPASVKLDSLMVKVRGRNPQALVVFSQAEEGLLTVVQAVRRLRWDVSLYSSIFPSALGFLKAAGKDAEGIIFATLPFFEDAGSAEGKKLLEEFLNEYGPMQSTDHLFFTTHAAFLALASLRHSAGDPRDALYGGVFPGLFGPFSFDRNGDITGVKHILKVIQNGRPVNFEDGN